MSKIVVTGGAGFIGSHVAQRLRACYPTSQMIILDKMTYAADVENIKDVLCRDEVRLVVGDICDADLCRRVLAGADLLVHLAAESHVDNSFGDSLLFTRTNTLGTHTLLEVCRIHKIPKIIHISTDEVYGEIPTGEVDETAPLNPTNPYSASKASAEMLVKSYIRSFHLPVLMVRANNIFGIRQFPEKLIPRCCLSLIRGQKIPMHGNGRYLRHYLAVQDFAEAISLLIEKGTLGETYNIGSKEEYSNLAVAEMICREFGANVEDHVEFVTDRPFNDQRYSISTDKIGKLGWQTKRHLHAEMSALVKWYKENISRYRDLDEHQFARH